jgi:hypothetical protein
MRDQLSEFNFRFPKIHFHSADQEMQREGGGVEHVAAD